LPLELRRANVEHHNVLCAMRLDVAAELERFYANEVGLCPMAKGQSIA
jgi:hypothetical protein